MLAPDDRAILREQLRPEPGAELEIAVATTFTMDLTAALVAPLAFAAHKASRAADPIAVLEAVRAATNKIDIFCQLGHIRVPRASSDLMAFLEPMIHEVEAPLSGFLFHPKVWAARYRTPDDDTTFRLLCGTRNLTDDASWDAVVRLDGHLGNRPLAANRPLYDLVAALPGLTLPSRPLTSLRRERIADLAEDLRKVVWELPPGVRSAEFHAIGLRRTRGSSSLGDALSGRRHLVVSPFADDSGIATATSGGSSATVVSTPETLERLSPSTVADLDCRVISPLAGLTQPDEEDAPSGNGSAEVTSLLGGLHAKVYVVEAGRQARFFVGSANATAAGIHRGNVEFVVELVAGRKTFGVDQFLGPDAAFSRLLEPYQPTGGEAEPPEETVVRELEKFLRATAAHRLTASITASEGGWTERVRGNRRIEPPPSTELRVGLLTTEGTAVLQEDERIDASFSQLVTADVTPFVVFYASHNDGRVKVDRATVVRAELAGDPPGRLDEVIARQVDTPEKFLRFLALLLGLSDGLLPIHDDGAGGGGWLFGRAGETGVFELVIRAVADRPAAIADLDRLVERLEATEQGREVLPDGFHDLWGTIRAANERVNAER